MLGKGFSQAELARRVGLAQPTIYGLINSNKIGSKHIHRIARELGTTPAYLTGETDDPDEAAPALPDLNYDERKLIECYLVLGPVQRAALLTIAMSMAGQGPSGQLHAPRDPYGPAPIDA